jgi:hypothetical protein
MSLNNIQLPSALVADLYAKSLVQDKDAKIVYPVQADDPVITNNTKEIETAQVTPPVTPVITKPEIPVAAPEKAPEPVAALQWKSLGQNAQKILILVNHPGITFLPDEELAFLTQMLQACKLSLGDVALLNLTQYTQTGYQEILLHFNSKTVFLFGVTPGDWELPINFPQFQVQQFDGRKFLHSPGLSDMMGDKLLKTKLWASLKAILGL